LTDRTAWDGASAESEVQLIGRQTHPPAFAERAYLTKATFSPATLHPDRSGLSAESNEGEWSPRPSGRMLVLSDLGERLDRTLDRLDRDVRELRVELRSEVSALRSELHSELAALRRDGMVATAALVAAVIGTGVLT
jgi:hypothetical protein